MPKTSEALNAKQIAAIPLIAQGKDYADGAKKAGISVSTMYDWLRSPTFQKALRKEQAHNSEEVRQIFSKLAAKAAKVLGAALDGEKDSDKIKAATEVLNRSGFGTESTLNVENTGDPTVLVVQGRAENDEDYAAKMAQHGMKPDGSKLK